MGRGKRQEPRFHFSPSHRPPRAFFSLTQASLGLKEASAEERNIPAKITIDLFG